MSHSGTVCTRDIPGSMYCYKGWKSKFTCPVCGKATWQHLNFLGRREVVCNGLKFSKVKPEELLEQKGSTNG